MIILIIARDVNVFPVPGGPSMRVIFYKLSKLFDFLLGYYNHMLVRYISFMIHCKGL